MRSMAVAVLAVLLCTACASSNQQRASPSGDTLVAGRGLTEEERCLLDRGVWRGGHCETCGGGM
jgi:hypothetical protein